MKKHLTPGSFINHCYISSKYETVILCYIISINTDDISDLVKGVEDYIKEKYFNDDIWSVTELTGDTRRQTHREVTVEVSQIGSCTFTIREKIKGSASQIITQGEIKLKLE